MKVVSGGTTITLPLGREARDPISALFYVRTLPLASGADATIPLNDSGRRMKLARSRRHLEPRGWNCQLSRQVAFVRVRLQTLRVSQERS